MSALALRQFHRALCGVWMWREAVFGAVIIIAGNRFLSPPRSGSTDGRKNPITSRGPTSEPSPRDIKVDQNCSYSACTGL
jgi:hypothetical protein